MRGDTHQQRHRRGYELADEMAADYLRHHPAQIAADVTLEQFLSWLAAQALQPTDPPPGNGAHHNGTLHEPGAVAAEHAHLDDDDRDSGEGDSGSGAGA